MPEYAEALKGHREVLESSIEETADKGASQEDPAQWKATFDLWIERLIFGEAKVSPEYDQFRK